MEFNIEIIDDGEYFLKRFNDWEGFYFYIRNELYLKYAFEAKRQHTRKHYSNHCALCGKPGIVVHHIDKDKKNNKDVNLINLCVQCHGLVHRLGNRDISKKEILLKELTNHLIEGMELFD